MKQPTTQIVILAAGYATRLYPLTLNKPKPLLSVSGKPIIEHIIDKFADVRSTGRYHIVTNAKFHKNFKDWETKFKKLNDSINLNIVSDGSTDETNKLGAIKDLAFVLDRANIVDDFIVVAGDNLFSESLGKFDIYSREKRAPVLAVYDVGNLNNIKRFSAISVDKNGRITHFEEKPKNPKSTVAGIALYFYPKESIPLIREYLESGENPDQPGRLVEWLYTRLPFYTWTLNGHWFDIGSREMLDKADEIFSNLS